MSFTFPIISCIIIHNKWSGGIFMKGILLALTILAVTISCTSGDPDTDYNRGYNKKCNYQYGEGEVKNSNCSSETF